MSSFLGGNCSGAVDISDGTHIAIVEDALRGIKNNQCLAEAHVISTLQKLDDMADVAQQSHNIDQIGYALEIPGWNSTYAPTVVASEPGLHGPAPDSLAIADVGSVQSVSIESAPSLTGVDAIPPVSIGNIGALNDVDAVLGLEKSPDVRLPIAAPITPVTPGDAPELTAVAGIVPIDTGTIPAEVTLEPVVDFAKPDDPALTTINVVDGIEKPTAPNDRIDTGGLPDVIAPHELSDIPVLDALTLPVFIPYTPPIDIDVLVAPFEYTEPGYTPAVLDELTEKIRAILGGALLVSEAVWDAMYDRLIADIAAVQVADEWQAQDMAASQSWSGMVTEALLTRIEQAQQRGLDSMAKARLQSFVEEAQQRRLDVLEGVKSGLSLETMLINHHNQLAERALKSAVAAQAALVAVHQANAARFNLLLARVAQQVAAGRLALDTALAPLEEFKVRLSQRQTQIARDDQIVKRWVNEYSGWQIDKDVRARVLEAQIKSYLGQVSSEKDRHGAEVAYESLRLEMGNQNISGFSAESTTEKARITSDIDRQRLTLSGGEQQISRFSAGASVEAQRHAGDVSFSSLLIEADKSKVNAYQINTGVEVARHQQAIAFEELRLRTGDLQTKLWDAQIKADGLRAQIDIDNEKLLLTENDQDIKIFETRVQAQNVSNAAKIAAEKLKLDSDRVALEEYKMGLEVEALKHKTSIDQESLVISSNELQIKKYLAEWSAVGANTAAIAARFNSLISSAQAQMQNEQIRQGYEQLKATTSTEEALRTSALALDKAKLKLENLLAVTKTAAELVGALAQSYLSAADYGVSTSASSNVSYNETPVADQ